MADIYIIYASENRDVARKLHELLSEQWDTGWDDNLVGDHRKKIPAEIKKAECVVPLYSAKSLGKDTVIGELVLAIKHNKEIVPIRLDDTSPPYDFPDYSSVDMQDWNGEVDHRGLLQLKRKLAIIVKPREKPKRPPRIDSVGIPLPTFFPSVSSHETQLGPSDAVSALRLFRAPAILISAYDLDNRRKPKDLIKELTKFSEQGGFVLIDSGNYEADRLGDETWDTDNFREALSQCKHDWAFCFDEKKPDPDPKAAVKQIIDALERDQSFTSSPVLPIVHAQKNERGERQLKNIPWIVREVAERLFPPLIGIPERELGQGLINRAKTVQAIREELSKLPFYQPIHILGTGNPWSIPVLAAAGADTFDGLEWCRMAVDRDTNRLHHFQHYDFFTNQKGKAESLIAKAFLDDQDIDFALKVVFHNLDYFAIFMRDMRMYFSENNVEAFMVGIMGSTAKYLKQQIPGIFK